MSRHRLGFTLLLLLANWAAAHASEAPSSDCSSMSSQTDMNLCFANQAKNAQQRLDALLAELGAALNPRQREQLAAVQAGLVAYRKADCDWQAAFFEGGSIQPMIYSACISVLTRVRIDELKISLCEGRGMTGECEASRRYDSVSPESAP